MAAGVVPGIVPGAAPDEGFAGALRCSAESGESGFASGLAMAPSSDCGANGDALPATSVAT